MQDGCKSIRTLGLEERPSLNCRRKFIFKIHNWWNGVNNVKATLKKEDNALRIGVLSAAKINFPAIIDPVQTHPGATLCGIAAREQSRAQAQINKHKLGPTCKAYGSYADLLADPNIDAVYVPLPNGLHCEWAVKAMEAGKHVLIEKPMTSNSEQARRVREVASTTNKIALEAFHWRFHPAAHRVKSLIESGKYGNPKSVYACMKLPGHIVGKDDIRLKYNLAGGASMDLTYIFSASSYFASRDFPKCEFRVLEAVPRLNEADKNVDEAITSKFVVDQEGKPPVTCSVEGDLTPPPFLGFIPRFWAFTAFTTIELEKAKIEFDKFVLPTLGHSITITEKDSGKKQVENLYVDGPQWGTRGKPWWTTYRYQLEAFVDMVRAKDTGTDYSGPWMSLDESEKLMEVIDSVYDKAGLPRRGI